MTHEQRLAQLRELHRTIAEIARQDVSFRRAIGRIPDEVESLIAHLARDPECWRLTRSLHAVHVPSFAAAVGLYAQMPSGSDEFAEDRAAIHTAFSRAETLFAQARNTLDAGIVCRARLEAEALADRAPLPAPAPEPSGRFGRITSGLGSLGASAVSSFSDTAGGMFEGVATRVAALPKLGSALGGSFIDLVSENVTSPVAVRLGASRSAIASAAATGTGLGVAIGILCPPLLPLAAGGAVLAALDAYSQGVDELSALEAAERDKRRQALAASRAQALRELAFGAGALQIESPDLSLTVDAETGAADAVVLSGPHAGRSYSSLTDEERAEIQSRVRRGSNGDEGRGGSGRSYSSLTDAERAQIQSRVRGGSNSDEGRGGSGLLILDILALGLTAAVES
ncbi:hypothetical protein [Leisingera caerulea]|uniref:hypothetical protein n=1 Tax=Leisingera caerulea TaxID=506591 RepID=UPI0004045BCA|nr:hypothetical protein [Leisingera caerulea]